MACSTGNASPLSPVLIAITMYYPFYDFIPSSHIRTVTDTNQPSHTDPIHTYLFFFDSLCLHPSTHPPVIVSRNQIFLLVPMKPLREDRSVLAKQHLLLLLVLLLLVLLVNPPLLLLLVVLVLVVVRPRRNVQWH